jgi:hypothetical protein
MLQGGQVLAARYVLLRKLGAGGQTQVWQARDRELGADRVLKLFVAGDAVARTAFLASAALQRELEHPRVQRCEAVYDDEPPFAVFPRVARGDLTTLRGRGWRVLLPVLAGVAEGLEALHGRGLVHRDLKPANVLLDEAGEPLLADFGLAAHVGDGAAPRGGSPFSMSPQQLGGAPPAIADDVYAFGATAYELLGGYPPFYPEASPARVREESPAPLPDRLDLPPALGRLVVDCLARDPAARPSNMGEVAVALRELLLSAPPVAAADGAKAGLTPPPGGERTIDPQWNRTTDAGPSPEQLHTQGFRRGLVAASLAFLLLVAGFVFFMLPRQVAQAPQETAPAAAAPDPGAAVAAAPAEPDLEALAQAKRDFEELQPNVTARLQRLEQQGAGHWGGEVYARGKEGLGAADAAFGRRDYAAALAALRAADADLEATEQRAAKELDSALRTGAEALAAGNAAAAQRAFELALVIDAGNAIATRGLERAGTLDQVRALIAQAEALEAQGDPRAAGDAYRKALELDRDATRAREALARLQAQASNEAFAAAMSAGLAALARPDPAAARAAFERAGRLRPGAPEVAEGLAQVDRALAGRSIGMHLEAAGTAEREERWADALAEYRRAREIDPNLLAARQGVERAEPRAMLDAELAAVIARPERLFTAEVRGAARASLQRARVLPDPGPVLQRQVETVERLLAAAETPLRVALSSDNLTEVTINRVGRLGAFERKDVELLPGRYTVVGVRAGYRDVRREITLLPGGAAPTVVIRCEEPI